MPDSGGCAESAARGARLGTDVGFTPDSLALNPTGRTPTLVDGDLIAVRGERRNDEDSRIGNALLGASAGWLRRPGGHATGDLAKRKLLPALYNLKASGLLPQQQPGPPALTSTTSGERPETW